MMDVQLSKILEALCARGYDARYDGQNIIISTCVGEVKVLLTCKLGENFPYEFPEVLLSKEDWDKLPSMPHKYVGGSICTFDKSVAIPNFNEPERLVVEVVDKAVDILRTGSTGENTPDYMDEFLAYWSTKSHDSAQMFVEDLGKCKELFWLKDKTRSVISDSYEKAFSIFQRTLGKEPEQVVKGLLVPTTGNISGLIPKNDLEFVKIIKDNSCEWEKYNAFVQDNIYSKNFFIVASELANDDKMLFGWLHHGPGVPDGFRKGHANLTLAFGQSENNGHAIAIDDCSQRRLFKRGGDGDVPVIENTCILGCGSIGSFIAEALLSAGTRKFALVDNDLLSYENIARHYVGYFWAGHSKVNAIKSSMELHNPNIECNAYMKNAFQFMEQNRDIIDSSDLLIIAVGYTPVEHYAIKLFNEGRIKTPILIVWTEPYAAAGHMLLLNKPIDVFEEVFDAETLEYEYSVVKNAHTYLKRESGCQSTYMPYSAFQLKEMIYRLLEPCLNKYLGTEKNYRLTWIGRLNDAKDNGVEINDRYLECKDYSVEIERLG